MSNKTEEALARSEQAKQLRDAWAAIAKVAELVKTHPFIAVNAANELLAHLEPLLPAPELVSDPLHANKPEQCCAKCGSLRLEPVDGQARPTFEGGEAEVRDNLTKAIGLNPMGLIGCARSARAEQAEAALAERDAAIVGLMDCLIETVGTPRVEALHGKRLDAAYDAAKTFLPAPEPVDPLVEALRGAIGGLFTPGWLEERAANLRAAIERAGGVKAVFGEGV